MIRIGRQEYPAARLFCRWLFTLAGLRLGWGQYAVHFSGQSVPVLVLNMWEWTSPELLDWVLGKQLAEPGFFEELGAKLGDFPTGLLVGTVEIVGCEKSDPSGEFNWQLANPERLAEPRKPENKPQPVWFTPFRLNSH